MSIPLPFGDTDWELNDITSLRCRYALARALHRGQKRSLDQLRRPSLPPELVLYIFRLCDLRRRDPSPSLYLPWLQERHTQESTYFFTRRVERQHRPWCVTPHLSEPYLKQIHTFRLRTLSTDRRSAGSLGEGSYSSFEIGILQRLAASEANVPSAVEAERTEVKVGSDAWGLGYRDSDQKVEPELDPSTGKSLRWCSHSNEVVGRGFRLHIGNDIGPEHDIWNHLRPGDRLGVWINVQSSGWYCSCKYANIEVWERWEPSWM
ncbi:hypothetical protein FRB95_005710 [Tulasnella sp. JGI-2019a]|nr:hypothetical protein FRB95_005710 [Tulasnella sp. JGI-2019a]